MAAEPLGQRAHEAGSAGFGARIDRVVRLADPAGFRNHRHDAAHNRSRSFPARWHDNSSARRTDWGRASGPSPPGPTSQKFGRSLSISGRTGIAGIVDQNVDAAECLDCACLDHRANGRVVGDVALHGVRVDAVLLKLGRDGFGAIGIEIVDHHACTPWAANSSAVSRPIPCPAPVTSAIRPPRSKTPDTELSRIARVAFSGKDLCHVRYSECAVYCKVRWIDVCVKSLLRHAEEDWMIEVEKKGAGLWIVLNRPDVLNALHPDMIAAINRALDDALTDRGPACRRGVGTRSRVLRGRRP